LEGDKNLYYTTHEALGLQSPSGKRRRISWKEYATRRWEWWSVTINRDLAGILSHPEPIDYPLKLWCKFAAGASALMNLWQHNCLADLRDEAFSNTFQKSKYPGSTFWLWQCKVEDQKTANKKLVRKCFITSESRLDLLNTLKRRIRVILKSTFYPHNFVTFNF